MAAVPATTMDGRPSDAVDAQTRQAIAVRVIGALPSCLIACVWIGPWLAGALFAAIAAYELILARPLQTKFVVPHLPNDPNRAERAGAVLLFIGSVAHTAPFAAAWIVGGQEFAFIAALFLFGTMVHAMTFYGANPLLFAAAAAPPFLVALIVPFFSEPSLLLAGIMAFAALHALFVVVVSIRERNRLNERTAQYRADALRAEEANAAKSQFLATMSHELRTPLNAVIGYAEIMQEDLEDGRVASPDDAKKIAGAGRNLLGLINDVLDLSKIEAGKMQVDLAPASIGEVVRTVADLCAHIAEKNGNTLMVSVDAKIGDVVTDAARLRQCALNLVSNACKFTKDGQVRVSAARDGERVRIEVADTGIGISEEQAARLFRPFEQADSSTTRNYGGTGLGLAITKKLCELLGGEVELKSALGCGTTITLWLPLTPVVELAQARAA